MPKSKIFLRQKFRPGAFLRLLLKKCYRLRREEDSTEVAPAPKGQAPEPVVTALDSEEPKPVPVTTPTQLGFDF